MHRIFSFASEKSARPKKRKLAKSKNSAETSENWSEMRDKYLPRDVYLAADVGIFFQTKVDECRRLRGDKCDSGDKSDDRFTVFACANLTGNDLRNLVVIGNYRNLPSTLNVNYHFNKNAWMTSAIFEKELREWNLKLNDENRKIVLFAEEKTVHPRVNLKNIKLMYYTDLISEKNVKFDMIKCLKAYYRRHLMESMMDPSFCMTPQRAIYGLREAWKAVSPDAVKSSFVESGIVKGGANVYLKVVESWSVHARPDFSMLKLYTEFDDRLTTSAEADSEDSDSEVGGATVDEAYESAKTLQQFYKTQGSHDASVREQILDFLSRVQKDLLQTAKAGNTSK